MLPHIPQGLATLGCAIEPGLALWRFRQPPRYQCDDGPTKFDDRQRKHLGRAAGKNAQVIQQFPPDDFLNRYRFACREHRTCFFGQGDERLPLRDRPVCVKREPKIRNTRRDAPGRHRLRQPRFACLAACFGGIDKVLEENA